MPKTTAKHEYTYLDTFQAVWKNGCTSAGSAVACRSLQGKKFEVLRVIDAGSEGPGDPTEDMHLCRFENDFEMACWAEEVVATIDGEPVVVTVGGHIVRDGHEILKEVHEEP